MVTVGELSQYLDSLFPPDLAESWDNVGLLAGDASQPVSRLMACLTLTPASVREAVEGRAEFVVAHHPLPFRPLLRLTGDSLPGRLLWELARHGIAIYSPHTSFDSAERGINQRLAEGLGLQTPCPLVPQEQSEGGSGRWGSLPEHTLLEELAGIARRLLHAACVQVVGESDRLISHVAVACGSGGDFLAAAREHGCQCLVTGEASFHTCLEAEAEGVALILPGHYASERFAVEQLAEELQSAFPGLDVWASREERDPLWLL